MVVEIGVMEELKNFKENRVVLTAAELGVFELVYKHPDLVGSEIA